VRPPGASTSLTLATWFPTMAPGSQKGTVLEAEELEGTIDELHSTGVRIGGIEAAPWGCYVTFDDPDCNGIVLQETTAQRP
jgi:hypothetical protein